jgi:hypothetical protein
VNTNERFATRGRSVEEAPEPFRGALRRRISSGDVIRLLAFGPAITGQGGQSPATLLALTERRWLLVSEDSDAGTDVAESPFDDTLLVELTEILHYGRLKIDYVGGGRAPGLHHRVLHRRRRSVSRGRATPPPGDRAWIDGGGPGRGGGGPSVEGWPIKFRNAVVETLPDGRGVLAATRWPAVLGVFGRELAPASALVANDRELLLISAERAWAHGSGLSKYRQIATYYPLARLEKADVGRHDRFGILGLEMHARHGAEALQVLYPAEHREEVARVAECALRRNPVLSPRPVTP